MSAQIGIPKYKDLFNTNQLTKMANNVKSLVLRFNSVSSDKSISNRESEFYEDYMNQYISDLENLGMIRQYAQNLVDMCNEASFMISKRSIEKHVYNWDDDDIM